MFAFFRFLVSVAYVGLFYWKVHTAKADVSWETGFLIAELILLGIPVGLLWVPAIGAKIADVLVGSLNEDTSCYADAERDYSRLGVYHARGWRRRALALGTAAYVFGSRKSSVPLVIALKSAKPKSWIEKRLALELFRFDHLDNCVLAYTVLRRNHRCSPPKHSNPEIVRVLEHLDREIPPAAQAVKMRKFGRPRKLKRNKNIKLGVPE